MTFFRQCCLIADTFRQTHILPNCTGLPLNASKGNKTWAKDRCLKMTYFLRLPLGKLANCLIDAYFQKAIYVVYWITFVLPECELEELPNKQSKNIHNLSLNLVIFKFIIYFLRIKANINAMHTPIIFWKSRYPPSRISVNAATLCAIP